MSYCWLSTLYCLKLGMRIMDSMSTRRLESPAASVSIWAGLVALTPVATATTRSSLHCVGCKRCSTTQPGTPCNLCCVAIGHL